ncbi:MAG: stage II sporulation protein M [Blastocatellia bacterium]
MPDSLIEKRREDWKRLETLVEQARGVRRLRLLTRNEVRELGQLYRRTASDLAIARVESTDQRLISYLNNLVIRAHGEIYRTVAGGVRGLVDFFMHEYPVIFRRTARYTLTVFLVFVLISALSFVATWRDDDFADFAHVGRPLVQRIKQQQMWTDVLNEIAPYGAAVIMANNIGVGFRVFSLSAIPVLGTLYGLLPTALQFGAINALVFKYGMAMKLLGFVAGHGVLEFTAIFVAGGAGLMIGLALIAPGERTRREALLERGTIAIRLLAGTIPMLILAGLIEAFISPLNISPYFKFGVSLATAILLAVYLLKPDGRLK